MKMKLCRGAVAAIFLCALVAPLEAQVNVTTFHNDNARTGQVTQETILTPSNVNSGQFGKLFTTSLDGFVYAQPLYLSNVPIGGVAHNVVYVATEHGSVYAIDAGNGTIYWKINLIPAGGATVNSNSDLGCGDLVPEVGITGTPVIDASTGTIYLVMKSKVGGVIQQYLHALDTSTAAEKFGAPVRIQASVPGTARDGNGSTVSFNALMQNQRAALLLENGHVVIGWSSHCDASPWHGWIMSYNARSLAQEAVFNTSPNGFFDGVWMSGGGLAADADGDIYFSTGNGSWNGTSDFGDSVVKLGPPQGGGFPVLDYFTPYDQATLASDDLDVSSGGLVLLPNLPSGKQLLAEMAKVGVIYLIDRNDMGKYCVNATPACHGNDPQIVEEVPNATVGVWGSPAYWNGSVYWGGSNENNGQSDNIKAFSFNAGGSGKLSLQPTSRSPTKFSFPSFTPSISANGNTNGILWGVDNGDFHYACRGGADCQVLYAYDATNLATMLYNSNQAANHRDVPGGAVKFTAPTIANGKVYVAGQYTLSGYGALNATITPPGTTTSVSLVGPANVDAIGTNGSAVANGGIDGGGYAYSATLLGATATWSGVTFKLGGAGVADAATKGATVGLPAGNYSTLYMLATGVNGNQPNQTFVVTYTDGTTTTLTQSLSDWYSPQSYPGESIALTEAYRLTPTGGQDNRTFYIYGYSFAINAAKSVLSIKLPKSPNVVVLALDMESSGKTPPPKTAATPTFSPLPGSFTTAQSVALSDLTAAATIHYTTNGTMPTPNSATYTAPITVTATTTIEAIATATGYTSSAVASGTYAIGTAKSTSVNLAPAASVHAIVSNGADVLAGGIDGGGYAYSANLLGATASWSGVTFTLGAAGVADAASHATVTLPAGNFSTLYMLATGVNGGQVNQKFVVHYTDGTSSAFTQSLSDWFSPGGYVGETKALTEAYRVTANGTLDDRTFYVYGYSFALDGAKTVQSVTLPSNRNVVVLALELTSAGAATKAPPAAGTTSVGIAAAATVDGIVANGSPVANGGVDQGGYAYSANLLGTTATWSGVTFTLGAAGVTDAAASGATIGLPAGAYSALYMLATGVNGEQANQTFVVAYTDGTTATFTQSLSDWFTPSNFAGESTALTPAYRVGVDGTLDQRPFYVYGYSFALDAAKTVRSVTLPKNRNVVVLAMTLGG